MWLNILFILIQLNLTYSSNAIALNLVNQPIKTGEYCNSGWIPDLKVKGTVVRLHKAGEEKSENDTMGPRGQPSGPTTAFMS